MKRINPKSLLVVALVAVVGMAFRVSWNALRDVAAAVGADPTAALLYPVVVDGLMALALVATLVLRGRDKQVALWVLGGYTVASLVLNYVHGLVPELHAGTASRLAESDGVNWVLVLLATSLPVGAIFFGSDLVAKVLHHRPDHETDQTDETPDHGADHAPEPQAAPEPEPVIEPVLVPELEPAIEKEAEPAPQRQPRPRRATGKVPAAAKSARPKRSFEELLDQARLLTLHDEEITAEKIRTELRVGPPKARELRDALNEERAAAQAQADQDENERRHGLHLVAVGAENDTDDTEAPSASTGTDH